MMVSLTSFPDISHQCISQFMFSVHDDMSCSNLSTDLFASSMSMNLTSMRTPLMESVNE